MIDGQARADRAFEALAGRVEPRRLFVPGRIEVLGKHTDYAGGRSLTCAAERGFSVSYRPRDDTRLRIRDARDGREAEWVITASLEPRVGHWTNYPMTVARRLARNFPPIDRGADIAFFGTLPRAAGLSTSSALITAVFLVLAEVNELESRPDYVAAIADRAQLAGYLGAVENGSAFGALEGDSGVGTSGGSEDHTAILLSTAGHVTSYGYHPVAPVRSIAVDPSLAFVVCASGIAANKTGSARARYNHASALAFELVRIADEERITGAQGAGPGRTLADVLDSSADAVDRLRAALARARSPLPGADLARRLDHFIAEDRLIVPAAIEALACGRLASFGALVERSQRAAEELLANQVPETITLARLARELGAHAASSFGAGFGGSVWALVDSDRAEEFAVEWRRAYADCHPAAAARSESFVTRPGAAAGACRQSTHGRAGLE